MPWGKRKAGDNWEVFNEESGDVKGTHGSESEADAQLAALYANADPQEESKMDKALFIPITKINIPRHEVWGYSTSENVDNSDEIMDYASTKPLMLEWSQTAQKRSGGKSLGNVRAMHQHIAAGKLISLQADDVHKAFYVGAKITDEKEWAKVEDGTYTGFSIGGSYFRRWPDFANPGKIRYTAKPTELSIVDAPCNPEATFQMVKMDGSTMQKKFKPSNGVNMIKVVSAPRMIKVVRPSLEKDFDPSEARDASGKWTSGGGGGFMSHPQHEDKPAKLSHPLHGTADTVIGRDGEPHPVSRGGGGKTDDEWADDDEMVSEGHQMASPKEMRQQLQADKNPPRPAGNKSPIDSTLRPELNANYIGHAGRFRARELNARNARDNETANLYQRAGAAAVRLHNHTSGKEKINESELGQVTADYSAGLKHYHAAQKVDSQGVDMDNPNESKTSVDMPEDLQKEPEVAPEEVNAPEAPNAAIDDTQPLPEEEKEDELAGASSLDVPEESDSLEDRALKIVSKAIVDLGEIMDDIESKKLSKQNIPGAPEPIASIPLESKVGPSFAAEQMPALSVPLELKPNAEPSQDVLATHAVTSKDLTAAFDAWLPKVGAMVKALIDERLAKDTQSAPAQTIVVDTKKKLIKVSRKES